MYDDTFMKTLNSLGELNGCIIYVPFSGPFLYSVNFKNDVLIEKHFENSFLSDRIKILPLDVNVFAVFFEKKLILFSLCDREIRCFQQININDKIRFIKTSLPETKVFSYSYFSKRFSIIIIIVTDNEIRIFRYNKGKQILALISVFNHEINWNEWINWDFFETDILNKEVSKSLIIDEYFKIDTFELRNNVLIRFLIIEKNRVFHLVEIIEDNNDYLRISEKLDKIQLEIEIYHDNYVIPMSFYESKLFVMLIDKQSEENPDGFLLIYDFGKK